MSRLLLFSSILLLFSACSDKAGYEPEKILSTQQLDSVLISIVTYSDEHVPDSVSREKRFNEMNKPLFRQLQEKYTFDYLYKAEDGTYYYFVHKRARGTDDLFVGIGGTFKLAANNQLTDFEESFRLWRMESNDLKKKGIEVFSDFVDHKPLDAYMNDEKKQYIEFPNEHVAYDKATHEWVVVKLIQ